MGVQERWLFSGRVKLYEPGHDDYERMQWEKQRGLLLPVRDSGNMIMDTFTQAFMNYLDGTATARDTMNIGYQALGTGSLDPVASGTRLTSEFYRKAKDNAGRTANQYVLSTTFSSLEANVPQGKITDNYAGSATPSFDTWVIAPDLAGLSPFDAAYVANYFKRFKVDQLVRIGLGSGGLTYVYARLTQVTYNAAATACTIKIATPLTEYPAQNATVDGVIDEAGVIADFPTVQTITNTPLAVPTLTKFSVSNCEFFGPGDYVEHIRPAYQTVNGATFDLMQVGTVDSVSAASGPGTVTLVAPGWLPKFPVTGASPAVAPVLPQVGDQVWGGRLYNWVNGLRFVKSRLKTILVETIFTTGK